MTLLLQDPAATNPDGIDDYVAFSGERALFDFLTGAIPRALADTAEGLVHLSMSVTTPGTSGPSFPAVALSHVTGGLRAETTGNRPGPDWSPSSDTSGLWGASSILFDGFADPPPTGWWWRDWPTGTPGPSLLELRDVFVAVLLPTAPWPLHTFVHAEPSR